jgi:hypothetical protein
MKKSIAIFCFLLLFATNLIAQRGSVAREKDSIHRQLDSLTLLENKPFFHALILKVNPLLALATGAIGELGGTLQYNISDTISIFAGGGYNIASVLATPNYGSPPGYSLSPLEGYTIRTGLYYYLKKHHFISFQCFYRKWNPTTEFMYSDGLDSYSWVNAPLGALSEQGGDELAYTIYRTSAYILSFDLLFGKQILGKQNTHLFFEWYVGAGLRLKYVTYLQIGQYEQIPEQYTPTPSQPVTYSYTYPDLKLGIQIGYKF